MLRRNCLINNTTMIFILSWCQKANPISLWFMTFSNAVAWFPHQYRNQCRTYKSSDRQKKLLYFGKVKHFSKKILSVLELTFYQIFVAVQHLQLKWHYLIVSLCWNRFTQHSSGLIHTRPYQQETNFKLARVANSHGSAGRDNGCVCVCRVIKTAFI